jgi:hypothetical protein
VSSPFAVITSKIRITEKDAKLLLSMIATSMQAAGFKYPIFVCVPLKTFLNFVGLQFTGTSCVHFSSFPMWWQNDQFSSFSGLAQFFCTHVINRDDQTFKCISRKFLEIGNFATSYKNISFYSALDTDPLTGLRACFQWESQSAAPSFETASNVILSIMRKSEFSRRSPLHSFVRRLPKIQQNNSFQIWLQKSAELTDRIENLFKNPKKNLNLVHGLAVLIAEHKTVRNFAVLWTDFLREVNKRIRERSPLPGLGDKIKFGQTLIIQKLEMINFCLRMASGEKRGFVQTEDQYEQSKRFFQTTGKDEFLRNFSKLP